MGEVDRIGRDRGLRDAALSGDERGWRALYDGAYAALDAYLGWRCGGVPDLTDEAAQETWLTAVRRLRDFDPEQAEFIAWLRGIAANVVRNLLRRRRLAPLPAELLARDARPEGRRIADALAALPEHYELVLRMKYLDGRTVDEIAAMTQSTSKAVESLLTRARAAFRAEYAPEG